MKKFSGNLVISALLVLTYLCQIPTALSLDFKQEDKLDNSGNCSGSGERG